MKNHSHPSPAHRFPRLCLAWIALAMMPLVGNAAPAGSIFTYQGRLNMGGAPSTDGVYDFRFTLHDASEAGSAIGSAVVVTALGVTNGLFTATLDFGSAPSTAGAANWLQLQVNTNGATATIWTDDEASNLTLIDGELARDFHVPSWGQRLYFRLRQP